MKLEVADFQGEPVGLLAGVLRLQEATGYTLSVPEVTTATASLGHLPLSWATETRSFTLNIGFWSGAPTVLTVVADGHERHVPVEVQADPDKLSADAWLALLTDLEGWIAGLSVGLSGGTAGNVGVTGCSAGVLVVALLPLVPALAAAMRAVAASPREEVETYRDFVPIHTVRKADRETLRWLMVNPSTAQALDRWRAPEGGVLDPRLPQRLSRRSLDHAVNRYVAWLSRRVIHRLMELERALLEAIPTTSVDDIPDWCRARASAAHRAAGSLDAIMRTCFLGSLKPEPASMAAMVVVEDDPLYARVHALARPFLSPGFQLEDGGQGLHAPLRPTFDLYEAWAFLVVQRSLDTSGGWTWSWHPAPGSGLTGGFGPGSHFVGKHPVNGQLTLTFNQTFRGFLSAGSSSRYSLSQQRRPDIVVRLAPLAGGAAWLVIDAKYRVSADALGKAFSSLHIYRDSLRWNDGGGPPRGGLLLVPAERQECAPWFARDFRDAHGIGAHRAAPGEEVPADLGAWILTTLAQDAGKYEP